LYRFLIISLVVWPAVTEETVIVVLV